MRSNNMSGETNLATLLQSMQPKRIPGEFVFVTLAHGVYGDGAQWQPVATFAEQEGLTLVIPKAAADQDQLSYQSVFSCITLTIHSSLDAVGLTAAFATKLAEHGLSANVIAGYYHDHIFVQTEVAEQALAALAELTLQP
ncbi:ACT domain-containing protein [Ferrimonas lipolytica]|uniref:ACT domain-containing protein n=2 Tax=Ferrimonas lipolytica TaxID=2724191 RepID=A0A6H1UI38_9GAMM|nr:ACT domain-containing protein [Ferrimonas lipolytica]